jgi:hypothetical protein
VAAVIKEHLHQDAELEPGGRGEFSVWVDGHKVMEKTRTGFPGELAIVESVKAALK